MPSDFVHKDHKVQIAFQFAERDKYIGIATVTFDDYGQEMTHDVTTGPYDDQNDALREVTRLAVAWIDKKRG